MNDQQEVIAPDQEEQPAPGHDAAFEIRRRQVAITSTGKTVHESCCGCVEFYHGCHAWPQDRRFCCADYYPLPDVMPDRSGQVFPPSRMQGRKEPRERVGVRDSIKTDQGALNHFVRTECANYRGEGCVFDRPCLVLQGKPCTYFERAVLGPPDYPYKTAGYDWQKLFEQYGQINPHLAGRGVSVRRCECGAVLGVRERICEKCRLEHRRTANRLAQKKKRLGDRPSAVNANSPQNS